MHNRFRFDGRPDTRLLRLAETAALLVRYGDTPPLDPGLLRQGGLPLSLGTSYFPPDVYDDIHELAAIDRAMDRALRQPYWQEG